MEVRAVREQLGQVRGGVEHLLEIVEQQQQPSFADVLASPPCGSDRLAISGRTESRIFDGRERNPVDAVPELLDELSGRLEREAGLPRAARPR